MSDQQKSLDLYADRPLPSFLRPEAATKGPPPRPRKGPPPRKKVYGHHQDPEKQPSPAYVWVEKRMRWEHFALANVGGGPPQRPRVRPEPVEVDQSRFVQSTAMPHPEWPLICRETLKLGWDSEKKMKSWLERNCPSGSVFKSWLCDSCGKWHQVSYPQEVSGTSSGKAIRKWEFMRRNGIDPYPELCQEKKS